MYHFLAAQPLGRRDRPFRPSSLTVKSVLMDSKPAASAILPGALPDVCTLFPPLAPSPLQLYGALALPGPQKGPGPNALNPKLLTRVQILEPRCVTGFPSIVDNYRQLGGWGDVLVRQPRRR